jgi:hypothetical protein
MAKRTIMVLLDNGGVARKPLSEGKPTREDESIAFRLGADVNEVASVRRGVVQQLISSVVPGARGTSLGIASEYQIGFSAICDAVAKALGLDKAQGKAKAQGKKA